MTPIARLLGATALAAVAVTSTLTAAVAQDTAAPEADAETTSETTAEAAPEAPAVDATAETVVATVNGQDITLGHLIVAAARLPQQYQQLPDDALFEGVLDQLVQQIAVADALEQDELGKGSALAIENERRSFLAAEALATVAEEAVTDEALKAAYDAAYANAEPTPEWNAAHILVDSQEKAAELKAQIDGGADFAELARENSSDSSAQNGGDLGWFSAGMMVEPFEQAVAALETGEVSEPVETQFGWHLVKLIETRDRPVPTMEEVSAELTQQIQREAIDAAVADAVEKAEVTKSSEGIDPAALRQFELITD